MNTFRLIFIHFVFSMTSLCLNGQTTEWIKGMNATSAVESTNSNIACVDEFGGNYQFCLSPDTLEVGGKQWYTGDTLNIAGLIKRNDVGDILWSKLIWPANFKANSGIQIYATAADKNMGIYFVIGFTTDSVYIGNYGLSNKSRYAASGGRQISVVKMDTSGKVLWHTDISSDNSLVFNYTEVALAVNKNNIAISLQIKDTLIINGTAYIPAKVNLKTPCIVNLSAGAGSLAFFHELAVIRPAQTSDYFSFERLCFFRDHLVVHYIANDTFNLNNSQFLKGRYLYVLDTYGKVSKLHRYSNPVSGNNFNYSFATGISSTSAYIFLTSLYSDSLIWNNKQYKASSNVILSPFVSCIDSNFNEVFTHLSSGWSSGLPSVPCDIKGDAIVSDGTFTYVCFAITINSGKQITFLSQTITGPSTPFTIDYGFMLAKLDDKGNILWNFITKNKNKPQGQSLGIFPSGDLLLSGLYKIKITLFDDSLQMYKRPGFSPYIAKINDYKITRGFVSEGPYCAGDTFELTYTTMGLYGAGNTFTTELSDENGNFTDTLPYYQIGSLKARKDSVIKCAFPKKQLSTSANYRIRIVSDQPRVQSFYRKDTLRILIYSRDSANLGKDTTICAGKSITLFTFGGTKWEWSPDSDVISKAGPRLKIRPVKSRQYKVTISDSSGCGVTDSDSIMVFVRDSLKILNDTLIRVCFNDVLSFNAGATGGDPKNYGFKYQLDSSNVWLNIPNKTRKITRNEKARIVLSDGCSALNDTLNIRIVADTLFSVKIAGDTGLCRGGAGKYKSTIALCTQRLSRSWGFRSKGSYFPIAGSSDSVIYAASADGYLICIVTDSLAMRTRKDSFLVKLKPLLTISENNDTVVCYGSNYSKPVIVKTGTGPFEYLWGTQDSGTNRSGDTITRKLRSNTVFLVKVKDKCMQEVSDTFAVRIDTLPSVSFFTDSVYCHGDSTIVIAKVGNAVPACIFRWWLDNDSIAASQSVMIKNKLEGKHTLVMKFRDACADSTFTLSRNYLVRSPLKTDRLHDTIICDGNTLHFAALITGGDSSGYAVKWINKNNNQISNTGNFTIKPSDQLTYITRIITDHCSVPADSQNFRISKLKPLAYAMTADTMICTGDSAIWDIAVTGGNGKYIYDWRYISSNSSFNDKKKYSFISPASGRIRIDITDHCSADTLVILRNLTVIPKAKASLAISPLSGCEPLDVVFSNNSTGANVFRFNGDTVNIFPFHHIYTSTSNNEIVFIAGNSECADTAKYHLTVNPKPVALFSYTPLSPVLNDKIAFINLSKNAVNYNWFRNGINISTDYNVNIIADDTSDNTMMLEAINQYNCRDTFTEIIKFSNPFIFFMPDAFSPNGSDNINDVFAPVSIGTQSYILEIYNRWGEKLYEGNTGWDGRYSGQKVMQGTYIWKLSIRSSKGLRKYTYGTVTVL